MLFLLLVSATALNAQVPGAGIMIKGALCRGGCIDSLLKQEQEAYKVTEIFSEATRINYYLWPTIPDSKAVDSTTHSSCIYSSRIRGNITLVYQSLAKSRHNAMLADFIQNYAFVLAVSPDTAQPEYKSATNPGITLRTSVDNDNRGYTIYSLHITKK